MGEGTGPSWTRLWVVRAPVQYSFLTLHSRAGCPYCLESQRATVHLAEATPFGPRFHAAILVAKSPKRPQRVRGKQSMGGGGSMFSACSLVPNGKDQTKRKVLDQYKWRTVRALVPPVGPSASVESRLFLASVGCC